MWNFINWEQEYLVERYITFESYVSVSFLTLILSWKCKYIKKCFYRCHAFLSWIDKLETK